MDEELAKATKEFSQTDPKIIAAAPEWVKRLFEWSKQEAKKI